MALPLVPLAIGAGAGAGLSSLFGKKEKPKLLMLPEQRAAYSSLLPSLTAKGMEFVDVAGQPFGGQMTAPMSEYETMGLKGLGEYLSEPLPTESNLFGMTTEELENTLSGKTDDPATGPYYEAYRTKVMREMQQAKDRIAARSSGRDAFFGGGRMDQEREVEEGAMGSLAQVLGRLFENERMNRLNAVPMALNQMGWAENVPQSRIAASQALGALPRQIEQAELTARYQDFVRQLQDMGMSLQAAVGLATSKPEYWMPQPADTSGMASGLGSLAMLAMMGGGGGNVTNPFATYPGDLSNVNATGSYLGGYRPSSGYGAY